MTAETDAIDTAVKAVNAANATLQSALGALWDLMVVRKGAARLIKFPGRTWGGYDFQLASPGAKAGKVGQFSAACTVGGYGD
ncbi:MAG: hypothetical protein NTY23_04170 [Chloroflexi bacterium]|nr:hypothetical protein [Chloroflexota bacterium]